MEEKQQNKQEEIEKRKRNFCKKGKFYILYFHECDTSPHGVKCWTVSSILLDYAYIILITLTIVLTY